jgi:hypothetical protein
MIPVFRAACLSTIVAALTFTSIETALGQGASEADGVFAVTDVAVDATAETAAAAREKALEMGHRAAFLRLMARLVPQDLRKREVEADIGRINQLVKSFGVDQEKTSAVRYLATLRFAFDRDEMRRFLREAGLPFAETRSKPVLVLPVLRRAGVYLLWDAQNTWRNAWSVLPAPDGLVPIVVPRGDLADINDISADQAVQGRRDRLDAILARYGATDAILALAAIDTGRLGTAPVVQVTVTRFGATDADRTTVLSVEAEPGQSVEDTIIAAAPRAASQIEEDWKLDNLLRFDLPQELIAIMPLADLSEWVAMKERLSKIAYIEATELLALSRQGATVRLRYFGNQDQLSLALSQRDVQLGEDDRGWILRLSSKAGGAPGR